MTTVFYGGKVYTGQLPLQGAFVCAGLNDSHTHLLNFGQALTIAPLNRHTASMADTIRCLKDTPPGRGGWILGRGWNQHPFTVTPDMLKDIPILQTWLGGKMVYSK